MCPPPTPGLLLLLLLLLLAAASCSRGSTERTLPCAWPRCIRGIGTIGVTCMSRLCQTGASALHSQIL